MCFSRCGLLAVLLSLLLASAPAAGADTAAEREAAWVAFKRGMTFAHEQANEQLTAHDVESRTRRYLVEMTELWDEMHDEWRPWEASLGCRDNLGVPLVMVQVSLANMNSIMADLNEQYYRTQRYTSREKNAALSRFSILYTLANGIFSAAEDLQRVVTLSCPAEQSMANVPGVSDVCKGLRVEKAARDTADVVLFGEGMNTMLGELMRRKAVEETCGDGWLYITTTEKLCKSARVTLAGSEEGQWRFVPYPSITAEFARAAQHLRKGIDQLCE